MPQMTNFTNHFKEIYILYCTTSFPEPSIQKGKSSERGGNVRKGRDASPKTEYVSSVLLFDNICQARTQKNRYCDNVIYK